MAKLNSSKQLKLHMYWIVTIGISFEYAEY